MNQLLVCASSHFLVNPVFCVQRNCLTADLYLLVKTSESDWDHPNNIGNSHPNQFNDQMLLDLFILREGKESHPWLRANQVAHGEPVDLQDSWIKHSMCVVIIGNSIMGQTAHCAIWCVSFHNWIFVWNQNSKHNKLQGIDEFLGGCGLCRHEEFLIYSWRL